MREKQEVVFTDVKISSRRRRSREGESGVMFFGKKCFSRMSIRLSIDLWQLILPDSRVMVENILNRL